MSFEPYPHQEKHTEHGAVVRDAIIGFADGLTVPFALTAGLSRYVDEIFFLFFCVLFWVLFTIFQIAWPSVHGRIC